jgi:lipopolysaccharide biosynthesis regulator YciM
VKRALAVDPECSKAHAVLGWINHLGGHAQKSVNHLKRALAISPNDSFALQGLLAVYVAIVGKIPAAITLRERLMRIDPLV